MLGLLAGTLLLAACGTPRDFTVYQETIAEFQTATDRTASVALEYVHGINEFEREYELKLLREDPARPLDITRLDSPILSNEALAARDRAFAVLKQYTQMLASLADSDASERWKAASERAKTAADLLVEDLSQNSTTLAELPLSKALSPLKAISDVIATEVINAKRAAALDAAVEKAAPAIQEISAHLREDLAFVIRQRDSVKLLEIAQLTINYGQAQADANNSQRLRTLTEIDAALKTRSSDLATMQGLLQTLDRFDAAHDALVRYAASDKGPQDLADLVAVVQSYTATAEQIFESFKKVKEGIS
ncbi:MAG: hypothetical protein Tsb0032_08500 [Kiloniellaceae bacterium]